MPFERDPYNSPLESIDPPIIVLDDNSYQIFNRWNFDMTSTIIDKTIKKSFDT